MDQIISDSLDLILFNMRIILLNATEMKISWGFVDIALLETEGVKHQHS